MKPQIYTEEEHQINQEHVDPNALEVIFRLKQGGHSAYLVGGGVRDLLLQRTPKDFDISTSAKPEEIKQLFGKRCLLIGKRFRLAHIRFGSQILEVSTFRAGDPESTSLIVRDNHWGCADEDVLRRDFTINGLFYDPTTRTVLDYIGGYEDLKRRMLRTIGDPHIRFKQDPVRMIRLIKFRARFDFEVDHRTEKAMVQCKEEIMKSAPARVLEEIFKMLESGSSANFFALMLQYDFLDILFPCFHHFFSGSFSDVAYHYLKIIDQIHQEQSLLLDRSILLAALVFPILEQELITLSEDRQMPMTFGDIVHLSQSLLRGISTSSFTHFPKKILSTTHFITILQYRLTPLNNKPRFQTKFPSHEDFALSLQFLKLRSMINPKLKKVYVDWKNAREALAQ
ncbi:MAG: polynucleotide adenylyltransferase PcnB [Verrucomicrobia bacterium]|nr:polynucleotide adenylyltransferase PcnB [Verrucomicrobiota bacterium]